MNGVTLNGKWKLKQKIGSGACADVYECEDSKYVAKLVKLPTGAGKGKNAKEQKQIADTLYYEYQLYNGILIDFSRAPERPPSCYGEANGYRFLILERLQEDLSQLSQSEISISEIATIGQQMIEGFKELHSKSYCFVDVKPENFMMKNGKLFFIDFGLLEKFIDIRTGKHKELAKTSNFGGTPTFSSLARHEGYNHSRRDDLEAMGYVLLSLTSKGKLPWSIATSDTQVYQLKSACDVTQLTRDRGVHQLADIINHCRNLKFEETPNYNLYQTLLEDMKHNTNSSSNKSTTSTREKKVNPAKSSTASSAKRKTNTSKIVQQSSSSSTSCPTNENIKEQEAVDVVFIPKYTDGPFTRKRARNAKNKT